ncbi:MAG TPA: 4a-hydroxytetrahydrobiopterin dehydratase [Gaiellaceae bacterium]|nr:4a-hydroxytetrahydrobiopterin dehydratase [Gaiellaceae bacterium]
MTFSPDWIASEEVLERTVVLPSFREAVALVNRIADLAEAENHHPELVLAYRTLTIRWTTHSAGGVTERDRALAAKTDELLAG